MARATRMTTRRRPATIEELLAAARVPVQEVPASALPAGFRCGLLQGATGDVGLVVAGLDPVARRRELARVLAVKVCADVGVRAVVT